MTKKTGVLFDLDGTLLNTALDLEVALNHVLTVYGRTAVDPKQFRYHVHGGSESMLAFGLGLKKTDAKFEPARKLFLDYYHHHIANKTHLYHGIREVIDYLNDMKIPWGIVTNKVQYLTESLLSHFDCFDQAGCVVCGDTLEQQKPDPMPLLYACSLLEVNPDLSFYVGDTRSDAMAASNANMTSITVSYGYHAGVKDFSKWNTNAVISEAMDILDLIKIK